MRKRQQRLSKSATAGVVSLSAPMAVFMVAFNFWGDFSGNRIGGYLVLLGISGAVAVAATLNGLSRAAAMPSVLRIGTLIAAWLLLVSVSHQFMGNYGSAGTKLLVYMLPLILSLTVRDRLSEHQVSHLLRLIVLACCAFAATHIAVLAGTLPGSTLDFKQSQSYLFGMLLAVALWRGMAPTLGVLAAVAASFALYPGASYLAATGTALATVMFCGGFNHAQANSRVASLRALGAVILGLSVVGVVLSRVTLTGYFEAIGKTNTVVIRQRIWGESIRGIASEPLLGSGLIEWPRFYSGGWTDPPFVTPHNDLLLAAAGLGLGFALLMVLWFISFNVYAWRLLVSTRRQLEYQRSSLVLILLAGFNAWVMTAMANSLLPRMSTAIFPAAITAALIATAGRYPVARGPDHELLDYPGVMRVNRLPLEVTRRSN